MSSRKVWCVALAVALMGAPSLAFSAVCTSSASKAVLEARQAAAQQYTQQMQQDMQATVEQTPADIAKGCISQLMQNGLGSKIMLPMMSSILGAGESALNSIINGVCQQAQGTIDQSISGAGNMLTNSTTLPYGLGGVSLNNSQSGSVSTPVVTPSTPTPSVNISSGGTISGIYQ